MLLLRFFRCFDLFFKHTATTEIYTYRHTLSLHDALPICLDRALDVGRGAAYELAIRVSGESFLCAPGPWSGLLSEAVTAVVGRAPRSEEHTSELQSLMRISSAVFCLKKKKPENRPKHV